MQSYETFYYFFNSFLFVRKSNKRKKTDKIIFVYLKEVQKCTSFFLLIPKNTQSKTTHFLKRCINFNSLLVYLYQKNFYPP